MVRNDFLEIYNAFEEGLLEVLSVSVDQEVSWKRVTDVTMHDVLHKDQFKVTLEDNSECEATGDHSLFKLIEGKLKECKTGEFEVGSDLVCVENNFIKIKKVKENIKIPQVQYMYDLSVEDNHNFVLDSGVLAHNTFRPPANAKFIQGQTQVFGFIWEDEELLEYIYMAIDDFNSRPPTTGIEVSNLWSSERRWKTAILLRASAFACFAIAMNWVVDEFSYSISGVSLDIEKSSKYMSIKDEFINEYDKLVEAAKRSIKIVKGLRQFKFGIGITSSLGPLSRPGIQSRRNMVEAGSVGTWS